MDSRPFGRSGHRQPVVRRTLRQPALIVPTILFPLLLLAINASGLDVTKNIPNFPADSYLDFALVVTFMQGGLFAATTAGTELATDIETGFLNRLQLTPLRAPAILVGQLAGAMAVAFLSSLVYLAVGLLAGATRRGRRRRRRAASCWRCSSRSRSAGWARSSARATGSAEAVQGMFPLLFVFFFLSSMNLPRNLIEADWFRTVASWNPISYLVEGLRSLVITGWDGTALLALSGDRGGAQRARVPGRQLVPADTDGAHMTGTLAVARAVARRSRSTRSRTLRCWSRRSSSRWSSSLDSPADCRASRTFRASTSRRLHGVSVRVRVPAGGRLRRGVHRVRDRGATSSRVSRGACCWPPRTARACCWATRPPAWCAGASPRRWSRSRRCSPGWTSTAAASS